MAFDGGYGADPYRSLCDSLPGPRVYRPERYRTEWGPVFHRGRLDGTARILVIGQDPAAHETVTRRILCGEAGHRVQGFLARLGIRRSYVMINAFAYSIYGQDPPAPTRALLDDRYRWIDAILGAGSVEAVVTFGNAARRVWDGYLTARSPAEPLVHAAAIHPTAPIPEATLLGNWNEALQTLHPAITHPDRRTPLRLYGAALTGADRQPIPPDDLPAGLPTWMAEADQWAVRGTARESAPTESRITATVPSAARPARPRRGGP